MTGRRSSWTKRFIKADLVPRGATGFQERYASVAPRSRGLWKGGGHGANDRHGLLRIERSSCQGRQGPLRERKGERERKREIERKKPRQPFIHASAHSRLCTRIRNEVYPEMSFFRDEFLRFRPSR